MQDHHPLSWRHRHLPPGCESDQFVVFWYLAAPQMLCIEDTRTHTHTHSIEDAVGHSIVTEMLFILEAEAKLCSQLLLLQQFLLSSSDFASELSWQVGPRDDPACPCPFFLSSS